MAMPSDFTGSCDYEKEEADNEYSEFIRYLDEYSDKENKERVEKLAIYWQKVLPETFDDFKEHWNLLANGTMWVMY